jgi:opacity protein-like surface antigen
MPNFFAILTIGSAQTRFQNDVLLLVNQAKGGNLSNSQIISGLDDALGIAHAPGVVDIPYASANATTPIVGTDVTSELVTSGYFTTPPSTTAFMYTLGGGVDIPVAHHWAVDVGYRFSRIQADTPLNAQGMTFGFGYRF